MRDPAFASLREAPVPDHFDSQMARLRAAPQSTPGPARAAALAAGLVLVVAACAVPVSVQSPLGYTVRWAVAGAASEEHASAREFEATVPEADRLVTAVDPGPDSTEFRVVVAGPAPDVAPLRADTSVREVRVEALTEPVRVPLGVWTLRRLGASRVVRVGTVRLDDARVQRLLAGQLAETGIDTSALALTVGRNETGRRTIHVHARVTRDGARSETTLPVGAGTHVRVRDGVVVMSGFPRGVRLDSLRSLSHVPLGATIVVRRTGPDGRMVNLAEVDSILRARGLDRRILDDLHRTLDTERTGPERAPTQRTLRRFEMDDLEAQTPAPRTPPPSPRP